jgi:hypothetical protein
MKFSYRHINIFTLAFLLIAICSCEDGIVLGNYAPSTQGRYLSISDTYFDTFLATGGTESFNVYGEYNTPWSFTDVAEWLNLSQMSGSSDANIIMTASENKSADSNRTSIFYFKSTDPNFNYNKAISVSQFAATPQLELSAKAVNFSGAAGSAYIDILYSNCQFELKTSASWLSVSVTSDNRIAILVSANNTSSARSATISVNSQKSTLATISVKQDASIINANETNITVENPATKYTIELDAEVDWISSSSVNWISVVPESGNAGKTMVSLDITANTSTNNRYGTVTFYTTSSAKKLTIYITQRGIYIDVDGDLAFSSKQESKNLNISSNTSWMVTEAPNWVTLSKASGNGNDVIIVTSNENPSTSSRSGTIVITQTGLSLKSTIKVVQDGMYFDSSVTVLEFTDKASTQSFNITSDANWSSTVSDNWFTTSVLSGYGDATIDVTVQENSTYQERIGTIEFVSGDKTSNVNVHQLAKYFTISNETFDFTSRGGTNTLYLSTNDSWSAEIEHDADWISLSSYSGEGDAEIIMTIADNPTINQRSTVVNIKTENDQSIRILVSQKPRYLTVNCQSISFFSKGGTSDIITISTDAEYSLSSSDSWFTINRGTDNTFTVYATENNSSERRQGSITIKMTNLVDCSYSLEIPVIQVCNGGSFVGNGYVTENDWDSVSNGNITLTIVGYNTDSNWDTNNANSLSILILGYSDDQNWNKYETANSQISISGYDADKDWNSANTTNNNNLGGSGYGEDNDWNDPSTDFGSHINGSGYGSDSNWDNSNSDSTGGFSGNGYGNDSNWDNSNSNSTGSVSGNGYGNDSNWDNSNSDSTGGFSGNGYGNDSNWDNSNSGSTGGVSGNGYGNDSNWDNSNSGSTGNVTGNGYGSDSNWDNSNSNSTGSVSGNGYGNDSNWDNSNSGSTGNVTGNGYGSDSNWDNSNSNSTGSISGNGYGSDSDWSYSSTKASSKGKRQKNKIKKLNNSRK